MNKQAADRLAAQVRSAGERSAKAVPEGNGRWHVWTSSGTVRSPFEFYYTTARLKKTVQSMRATIDRLDEREAAVIHARRRRALKALKARSKALRRVA